MPRKTRIGLIVASIFATGFCSLINADVPVILISPEGVRGNPIVGHHNFQRPKPDIEWAALLHKTPETNVWSTNTESPEEPIEKQLVALNAGTPIKLYAQPEGSLYEGVYISYEYQKKYRPIWVTLQFLHDKTPSELMSAIGSGTIDPQIMNFFKNEKIWNNVVSLLNKKASGQPLIMQLSGSTKASTPITAITAPVPASGPRVPVVVATPISNGYVNYRTNSFNFS